MRHHALPYKHAGLVTNAWVAINSQDTVFILFFLYF
jgi:hypothetical protein